MPYRSRVQHFISDITCPAVLSWLNIGAPPAENYVGSTPSTGCSAADPAQSGGMVCGDMSWAVVLDPIVPIRSVPRDPPFPSALSPLEPTPTPIDSRGRTRPHDPHHQTGRRCHVLWGERLQSRRRRPPGMNENNSSIVALLLWLSSMSNIHAYIDRRFPTN